MRDCAMERIRRDRSSPTSPRLVVRRVLVLAEGRQFREAAAVLQRLAAQAVAAAVADFPLDLIVEGLPHSAHLLETLFNKLIASGQRPNVNAEQVVWQLVRLLASHDDPTLKTKVARLAKALLEYQPDLHRQISNKKKALEQAVEGLGCHGLTADASIGGLTHLHAALRTELQRHVDAYKNALHRLDELWPAAVTGGDTKKPVDAGHQRLLAVRLPDVQQRLIDNKTLLTMLDKPALKQLQPLVQTLADRVQNDKEALFCVNQLKRLQPVSEDLPVASILMSFSRGCGALLDLMQIPHSPCYSDTGYHSETDAEQELSVKDVMTRYETLYHQYRPRALEALDALPELRHATQLKSKILFSVVVLAFRTCRTLRDHRLQSALRQLQLDPHSPAVTGLRKEMLRCLGSAGDACPLQEAESQVVGLVCDTLREYRCLEGCDQLRRYAGQAARVAWAMVCAVPPYELDTDFATPTKLQPEKHQRHHSSDRTCDTIRAFIWPAVMCQSRCVFKAVVVTDASGT
ncbi:unnamed protein product [Callosobruchus maculatus]|uniref:Mitochondria-eating protein n=1 Tax=Callosobruchus maculatus TaxID=64391 RepID=A0A653CZI8_CALMS|nr:unnamed protein product [Callosobruchus maculatus]